MNETPQPPQDLALLRDTVQAMPMARLLQLRFTAIGHGTVEIEMPVLDAWCFKPGQLQASALFAAGDFAAVAAVSTMLPAGSHAATLDAHVKLLAPARGTRVRARGRAVHLSGTVCVGTADIVVVDADGGETLAATLLASARRFDPRPLQRAA